MAAYRDDKGVVRQGFAEIADGDWRLCEPTSLPTIQAAAILNIDRTLKRIEALLNQLGSDGIHPLIREGLSEVRATRRKRLKRSG